MIFMIGQKFVFLTLNYREVLTTSPIFVLQLDLVLINIQSRLEFEKTKLDKSEGLGDKPICSSTL